MNQKFLQLFQNQFELELINNILNIGLLKTVPEASRIIEVGTYVPGMPIIISGAVKVLRDDANGNELLLYYLKEGQTCTMTISGCIKSSKSEIRAIAETETELLIVPTEYILDWTKKYKAWRNFVFESYDNRLNELLFTIDNIAFSNMDDRVRKHLEKKARINKSVVVNQTHQQIAYELNTSRVVVSRLLKKLENNGEILLHRNYIKITGLQPVN